MPNWMLIPMLTDNALVIYYENKKCMGVKFDARLEFKNKDFQSEILLKVRCAEKRNAIE